MRLTVQLYTVRDALAKDFRATLSAIADMGIEYVEIAGLGETSLDEWAATFADLGLKASGAHVMPDAILNDFDGTVKMAKTLGFKYVIAPWAGEQHYGKGWDVFGKQLDEIGAKLAAEGLQLCYHNHDFEFKGGDHLAELYANAAPENLKAEIDVAWIQIGGHNPAEYVAALGDRVALLHVKDFDPAATPRWKPAGQGVVDLKAVIAAAPSAEFAGIELDESPGDPVEAVRASAEYLHSLGLR